MHVLVEDVTHEGDVLVEALGRKEHLGDVLDLLSEGVARDGISGFGLGHRAAYYATQRRPRGGFVRGPHDARERPGQRRWYTRRPFDGSTRITVLGSGASMGSSRSASDMRDTNEPRGNPTALAIIVSSATPRVRTIGAST